METDLRCPHWSMQKSERLLVPCCGKKEGRSVTVWVCGHDRNLDKVQFCSSVSVPGECIGVLECPVWRRLVNCGEVAPAKNGEVGLDQSKSLVVFVPGTVEDVLKAGVLIGGIACRVVSDVDAEWPPSLSASVSTVAWIFGRLQCDNSDGWLKIALALEKSVRNAFWLVLADDGCRVGLCSFAWANQFIEWLVSQDIKMPTPDDFSRRMEIDPGSSSREGIRNELHAES